MCSEGQARTLGQVRGLSLIAPVPPNSSDFVSGRLTNSVATSLLLASHEPTFCERHVRSAYPESREAPKDPGCLIESVAAVPVIKRAPRLKVKYSNPHWTKTITRLWNCTM
jgi:hypothetical protein